MSLDSVLKKLESRIEEFVEAHQKAAARIAELEGRIQELEGRLGGSGELEAKVAKLESQREELAERLGKVLGVLDKALASTAE
jgi:chromosome segregation ATPase